jgi:flavin-dependent dehydrogenase
VNLVMSLRKVRNEKINLREHLDRMLRTHPVLKTAFAGAVRKGNPEGSKLYLGLRRRAVSGDGFLLAGDAAGLIEFFSGNGIPQAYGSGTLAAEIAGRALQKGDFSKGFLKQFDEQLYQKYRPNGLSTKVIFPMLHHPLVGSGMLKFLAYMASRPQTNDLLRDLLYQKNPVRLMRNPRFLYDLLFRNPAPLAEGNPKSLNPAY